MQVHPPQQAGHSNEERADEGNKKITERGRNGRRGTTSKRSAIKQKSPKSQDRPVLRHQIWFGTPNCPQFESNLTD